MTTEHARIPLISLYNNLIVSIQVELSDTLVLWLKDDVTRKIQTTGVRGLVIDLTGIDLMDSYITRAIRDLSVIAKLMGVTTVIAGIRPMIAMTLVEMGMDLQDVQCALNLESALEILSKVEDFRDEGEEETEIVLESEDEAEWSF